MRALFYSHDTVGLGHIRRTMALCTGLGERFQGLSSLILTGSPFAHRFRMPQGTDIVKLPSVRKLDNELYEPRSLSVPFEDLLEIREQLIYQTARAFAPDFLLVDNVPLGMRGELLKTLRYLRRHAPHTKVCLNLRDIVDSAAHVIPLWTRTKVFDALERYYDRILIYGEPSIYDPLTEYNLPGTVRKKSRFCGYIPRPVAADAPSTFRNRLGLGDRKLIVVTVGGGTDGALVIRNYLEALSLIHQQVPAMSIILSGPEADLARGSRTSRDAESSDVQFVDFSTESLAYMAAADLIVAMGGYNTVSEILALGKPSILVPRIWPRTEQLIRASRLHELSLTRMIHPQRLTPEMMALEIQRSFSEDYRKANAPFQFRGVESLSDELLQLSKSLSTAVTPAREAQVVT